MSNTLLSSVMMTKVSGVVTVFSGIASKSGPQVSDFNIIVRSNGVTLYLATDPKLFSDSHLNIPVDGSGTCSGHRTTPKHTSCLLVNGGYHFCCGKKHFLEVLLWNLQQIV